MRKLISISVVCNPKTNAVMIFGLDNMGDIWIADVEEIATKGRLEWAAVVQSAF
jgi:hypothetical protein